MTPLRSPAGIVGAGVSLLPIRAEDVSLALTDATRLGLELSPGWPHADSEPGLRFAAQDGAWLILDAERRVIGECGVKAAPGPAGCVEIGYGLAGPSRGKGLGTAAVAALVGWLFERGDVEVVEAEVGAANLPSHRLLLRLGFEPAFGGPGVAAGSSTRYRRVRRG